MYYTESTQSEVTTRVICPTQPTGAPNYITHGLARPYLSTMGKGHIAPINVMTVSRDYGQELAPGVLAWILERVQAWPVMSRYDIVPPSWPRRDIRMKIVGTYEFPPPILTEDDL